MLVLLHTETMVEWRKVITRLYFFRVELEDYQKAPQYMINTEKELCKLIT